jgi:hypothetical protein
LAQPDNFKVTLTHQTQTIDPVEGTITYLSEAVNKYKVEYTLLVAGPYLLRVQVQPNRNANADGPWYDLAQSPLQVEAVVTEAYAYNTKLTGAGVKDATAGILQTFTVTLFDVGDNQLVSGGDTLQITITDQADPFEEERAIEIFDNDDGTYLVKYLITKAA